MSIWRRIKDAFRPPEPPPPQSPGQKPGEKRRDEKRDQEERRPVAAPVAMPPEEAYLRQLLARLGLPPERSGPPIGIRPPPPPGPPAQSLVGGREFWAAIDRLLAGARDRTAIELLGRFAAARPDDHALAARLVELLCDRLEHEAALPHLERLVESPPHALRARFLLAEAYERTAREPADLVRARRAYEHVLAVDVDYPKARTRAERLRPRDEPMTSASAAETVAGVEALGADVSARYRLKRELGRGGAGAVYLAVDQELEREVALKILHPHASSRARAEARARSFNEARIAAALRHPGVVAIYDLDEERNLIAMELCRGGTLRELLQRGRLAPGEALRRGAELAATLDAVHRAGVVHRDLKPGNLLFRALPPLLAPLDAVGELVLGDFGLARLGDDLPRGEAAGTLAYTAPEQRLGEASPAVDLWALGVILHEMLTGRPPFDAQAVLVGARGAAVLPNSVATSLGEVVSLAMRELIDRLLAEEPSARPSAVKVKQRLDELRWLLDRAPRA